MDEEVKHDLIELGETHPSPLRRAAVPGMKKLDGGYIAAVVPPEWEAEQTRLSKLVLQTNKLSFSPNNPFHGLKHIAGVDISFVKNTNTACAMLSILKFPELVLEYQTYDIVEMMEEYIPFYLAFREVKHLVTLFERVKREKEELWPQVVFVDGSGVWHPKGLGLASHLGVLLSLPTIGIAKSLLYLPDIPPSTTYDYLKSSLSPTVHSIPVRGISGRVYGAAVVPRKSGAERPIFVSVGHMIDLDTCIELVHETSLYRVPEAIRAADGGSREVLRVMEEKEVNGKRERG